MLKYGDRIAKLREQFDLTQEELSNKIGISRAALSHYEKNRREPDYETLQRIAKYFEVTTDYLLGGLDNARPQTVTVAGREINLTEEEFVLFNELKKHPIMMHDLASDPERKVKELIRLYKMKQMFLEEDEEDYGDGFGSLKD